jgi:hypothetical protein
MQLGCYKVKKYLQSQKIYFPDHLVFLGLLGSTDSFIGQDLDLLELILKDNFIEG